MTPKSKFKTRMEYAQDERGVVSLEDRCCGGLASQGIEVRSPASRTIRLGFPLRNQWSALQSTVVTQFRPVLRPVVDGTLQVRQTATSFHEPSIFLTVRM